MAKILHVVNSYDPSNDVVRCVRELKRYSKHQHNLFVRDPHPLNHVFYFKEHTNSSELEPLLDWCDAIIYQFAGFTGYPDAPNKPAAFRNINIQWDVKKDKFWCWPACDIDVPERYRLLSSSHVGAKEFLPSPELFRWLPDMISLDEYAPGKSRGTPLVSYIKHHEELSSANFKCESIDHHCKPHVQVVSERKKLATIAIDNVCDGHFGLSGLETMAMGIQTVVFNHDKTREALRELSPGDYPPFLECAPSVQAAVDTVNENAASTVNGPRSRAWMEKWYHPKRLVSLYWDTFVDELISC